MYAGRHIFLIQTCILLLQKCLTLSLLQVDPFSNPFQNFLYGDKLFVSFLRDLYDTVLRKCKIYIAPN